MLKVLQRAGVSLAIVSSNTRANVRAGLGELMAMFGQHVLTRDDDRASDKTGGLLYLLRELQLESTGVCYVGDQLSDYEAASATGLSFLGVSYGWGLAQGQVDAVMVNAADEISRVLLDDAAMPSEMHA
jgi:phosphoglycolate phosphatase